MRAPAITFVGLGPGDARLLTQRAADRLAQADVVLGEDATLEQVLALAREGANQGKRVVRTVPFDAFDSPRVVDEVRAVRRAGLDLEVVPGIGAQTAAATFAGALGPARYVAREQVGAAVASSKPEARVTLIANAGSPSQRVVTAPAGEAQARAAEMDADGVIVVLGPPDADLRWFEQRPLFGKRVLVTRAREQAGSTAALLREYGAEPVIVPTIEIRPPQDPSALAQAIGDLRAGAYAWAAFTSANGVDRTWDALAAMGADARAFGGVKLAAIGPATAAALERRGLRADVVAKEFRGEGLAEAMLAAMGSGGAEARSARQDGPAVLLARAAKARDVLPETLRAAGCRVDVVAAYETHPPPPATVQALAEALASGAIDAVTFTSSSTVDNFCDLLDPPRRPREAGEGGDAGDATDPTDPTDATDATDANRGAAAPTAAERLRRVRVASIGPITTDSARARGIRVDVTAREYTVFWLVQALAESYG